MDEKKIPEFRDEDEEREFWSKHDSADYVDWEKAKRAKFLELKVDKTSVKKKQKID